MDWPSDADGDVFRRLQESGFDFAAKHTIDFNMEFESWPPAKEVVTVLSATYGGARIYQPDKNEPGYVLFQICDVLSYDLVMSVQREATALLAPYGGVCESWGVLHG
jgi:hypothetical protein